MTSTQTNLLRVREALVRDGVDQHPEPEARSRRKAKAATNRNGQQPEDARPISILTCTFIGLLS